MLAKKVQEPMPSPSCRYCRGKGTVKVKADGKTQDRPCPHCRGSRRDGLVTK